MLPFHGEPVICENIIARILFASSSAKISYRENFHVNGIYMANMAWKSESKRHANMQKEAKCRISIQNHSFEVAVVIVL